MSKDSILYDGNTLIFVPAIETIVIKATAVSIKGNNIGDYAFISAKDSLISFSFEENPQLESISPYCFYKCSKLQSADLSMCTKLTCIAEYAFNGCSSMTSVLFPSSLTEIKEYSFAYSGLISVEIPKNFTTFGSRSFAYCSSLSSFVLPPDSVLTKFTQLVLLYSKIRKFFIPKSIIEFSAQCFSYCNDITTVEIDPDNIVYTVVDNVVFLHNMETLVYFPGGITGSYTIPETCIILDSSSFSCSLLTNVIFHDNSTKTRGQEAQLVGLIIP